MRALPAAFAFAGSALACSSAQFPSMPVMKMMKKLSPNMHPALCPSVPLPSSQFNDLISVNT
jgi:hypothetical protein